MMISKMLATKQHKEECMYHRHLIERLTKDPDYQQMTTHKLNRILHQTGKSSPEYLLRRTNEKADGLNAPKYKIVPTSYMDLSKAKRDKAQLELLIKVVDYMTRKFGLEKELSDMFD